jgi:hypothetical protein
MTGVVLAESASGCNASIETINTLLKGAAQAETAQKKTIGMNPASNLIIYPPW